MLFTLLQDFQFTSPDGVILLIKKGTKIEKKEGNDYIVTILKKDYKLKSIIVENNPTFFFKIDFKTKLINLLKENSKRTAPKLADILSAFIENEYLVENQLVDLETLKTLLDASRLQYMVSEDTKWLAPLKKLGWKANEKGIFKE